MGLQLITAPAVEPVDVAEAMLQLGLGSPSDTDLNDQLTAQLTGLVKAARRRCENITGRAFITQRWKYTLNRFPRRHGDYYEPLVHDIPMPLPNFQGLDAFTYIDVGGVVQDNMAQGAWGYQIVSGGDTRPAKIRPPYLQGWPPTQFHIADPVSFTYLCGYGNPATVSMTQNLAVLQGPVFTRGSVGMPVTVPGAIAGTPATDLVTTIASIDGSGQATLAANATAAVTNVSAWIGQPVPDDIVLAIKLLVQFLFQNGSDVDLPVPRVIEMLLSPYVNEVS